MVLVRITDSSNNEKKNYSKNNKTGRPEAGPPPPPTPGRLLDGLVLAKVGEHGRRVGIPPSLHLAARGVGGIFILARFYPDSSADQYLQ